MRRRRQARGPTNPVGEPRPDGQTMGTRSYSGARSRVCRHMNALRRAVWPHCSPRHWLPHSARMQAGPLAKYVCASGNRLRRSDFIGSVDIGMPSDAKPECRKALTKLYVDENCEIFLSSLSTLLAFVSGTVYIEEGRNLCNFLPISLQQPECGTKRSQFTRSAKLML